MFLSDLTTTALSVHIKTLHELITCELIPFCVKAKNHSKNWDNQKCNFSTSLTIGCNCDAINLKINSCSVRACFSHREFFVLAGSRQPINKFVDCAPHQSMILMAVLLIRRQTQPPATGGQIASTSSSFRGYVSRSSALMYLPLTKTR